MKTQTNWICSASLSASLVKPMPFLLFTLILLLIGSGLAQDSQNSRASSELYDTIAKLDAALFETYNTCQLDKNEAFFTEDIEFYHDQGGLSSGRDSLLENMRNNICGGEKRVRRELVKGSLEVDQIKNYGAVEIGEHRFYQTEKGQPEKLTGTAKFVHVWQKKDGQWRISRVISYAHRAVE